jgi:uncharacterized protein (DUF427 family)
MPKAIWNGQVVAQSDATIKVEGNDYFPPDSVEPTFLKPSGSQTVCPWKGTASYYDVVVDDKVAPGAAWYYKNPKPAASEIKDYVAFWRGVTVKGR